jgi:hypothetical protein
LPLSGRGSVSNEFDDRKKKTEEKERSKYIIQDQAKWIQYIVAIAASSLEKGEKGERRGATR